MDLRRNFLTRFIHNVALCLGFSYWSEAHLRYEKFIANKCGYVHADSNLEGIQIRKKFYRSIWCVSSVKINRRWRFHLWKVWAFSIPVNLEHCVARSYILP